MRNLSASSRRFLEVFEEAVKVTKDLRSPAEQEALFDDFIALEGILIRFDGGFRVSILA